MRQSIVITWGFLLLCSLSLFGQESKITGRIIDESNIPISGASIAINGLSIGTTTDSVGHFSLAIPTRQYSSGLLTISSVGYLPQEISYKNKYVINVTLQLKVQSLNDVVVVGYGKQKKATVTGAVSEVKGEEVAKNAVADISNSIAGRLSGVIVTQSNAEPGDDAAQILIRGQSTFNNASPLVLVDGVQREFNRIDPNDVESLTVLKDASATAVYGVRGANGVILITTKRGKSSKPTVAYSGYYGVQNATRIPHYLNSYDFARLYNEAQVNDGVDPASVAYKADDLQKYKDGSDPYGHADNNWFKEILRTNVPQQRHSVSLSGGSQNVKYFTSFGFLDQDGLIPNVNFKSYSVRANIDADVSKSTKLSVNFSALQDNRNYPGIVGATVDGGIFGLLTYLPPNAFPLKNEDGSLSSLWGQSPLGDVTESGYRKWNNNTVQSSVTLEQKLDFVTKGLAIRALGSYDAGFRFEKNWTTPYQTFQKTSTGYDEVAPGALPSLFQSNYKSMQTLFEGSLTYDRNFGKHAVTGLLLYTQQANYDEYSNEQRVNYQSSAIDELFAGPTLNATNYGSATEAGRQGFVGRVTYGFDNKYLAEANFGYNGSDNFPKGRRYGFFPSGSLGWVLSKEEFLSHSKTVSFLKLRVSYGEVGNDQLGGQRFLYLQPFTFGGGTVFGGASPIPAQTITIGSLPNTSVTWEKAQKSNLGADARFFKDMLSVTVDLFYEKRNNILAYRNASVPATFGASLPAENIGKVDNKGFEFSVSHTKMLHNFEYTIGGNFTYVRNKILFIDEPENVPSWQRRTGLPIGQFFGYIAQGLYMTQKEIDESPKINGVEPQLGEIIYKDINGDGVITPEDQTSIGHSRNPEIMYGINLSAKFKGFDVSALIQGAGNSNVYFDYSAAWPFIYGSSALDNILNRWTPDNPNPTYPRLTTFKYEYNEETSSYWLRNAAYWRVKNIQAGYTLPKPILQKLGMETLRIYIGATNPYTRSKFKDWDPEAPSGAGFYSPQLKITTVGITANF